MENKYLKRLLDEWNQYGKIVIAVDYDDTISPWRFKDSEDIKKFDRIIKLLKDCRYTGAFISIFTSCNQDRYDEIKSYCYSKGLHIDSINETPISLPYGNNGKIWANIFLDDRAGLDESISILESALYKRRSEVEKMIMNNYDDVA
jgi:hypothetical protein